MKKILITGLSAMLLFCFANLSFAQEKKQISDENVAFTMVQITSNLEFITANISHVGGVLSAMKLKNEDIKRIDDLKSLQLLEMALYGLKQQCTLGVRLQELKNYISKLEELEKYEYFYELVTYYAKSKKEQSKQLQRDIYDALDLVKDQITVLETKKETSKKTFT